MALALIIRLAWRNVFRNTRRTLLAGLASGIGLASVIFTDALIIGMEKSMIRTATDTLMGHGQVHAQGFRQTLSLEKTIANPDTLLALMAKDKHIASAAGRILSFAMLNSPANSGAVLLYGIDPSGETSISKVDEALVEGQYLQPGEKGQILIGSKLAASLEVGLGDRVVLTAAQAESGELVQELFRIKGIFRFGIRGIDDRMVFAPLGQVQAALGLEGQIHEIAFRLHDIGQAAVNAQMWDRYSSAANEALGWPLLLPELAAVLEMSQISMFAILFILFGIVGLSIMNVLFMALYERTFEFGVLRAVGTRPLSIAALILCEAAALALISSALGMLLGFGVTYYLSISGIDYIGIEYAGVTFRELIYPTLSLRQFYLFPLWVLLFSLVAGIYPAISAARKKPAEAMGRSF